MEHLHRHRPNRGPRPKTSQWSFTSQRMRIVSYVAYPRRMTLTWLPCCAELGTIEIRALTFAIADAVQVARENLRLCPPKKVDGILTEPVARPSLSVRAVEMTTPSKVM